MSPTRNIRCSTPILVAMLVSAACLLCACHDTQKPAAPPLNTTLLDGQRALGEVRAFVALGARDSGTLGAVGAAEYLQRRLARIGIAGEMDTFTNDTPQGRLVFRNVVGTLTGRADCVVILASHYDTKTGIGDGFVGANDGGSSTGLLLELGRVLASLQGAPTVILAFFDGEECRVTYGPHDGLHGSRRCVEWLRARGRLRDVRAVILLDMIGDADLNVMIPRNSSPELTSLAFTAARAEGVRDRFGLHGGSVLDDHVPFLEAGVPAIDLIDFEYGSAPGRNDFWHTTQDTLDKLSADSLQTVGRVVLRMVGAIAASRP